MCEYIELVRGSAPSTPKQEKQEANLTKNENLEFLKSTRVNLVHAFAKYYENQTLTGSDVETFNRFLKELNLEINRIETEQANS